jgi:hypothetical protein
MLHCMSWREATGVERADVSAETGEVKVRVTGGVDMDPEKLCCLLQEATKKKCVRIVQEESVPSPGPGPGPGRIARPGQTKNTSMSGQVRLASCNEPSSTAGQAQRFCPETDCVVSCVTTIGTVPRYYLCTFLFFFFFPPSPFIYLYIIYVGHEKFWHYLLRYRIG